MNKEKPHARVSGVPCSLFHGPSPRGFTLIELLIVIAIIGILSSVVIADLGTSKKKAKGAAFKSEVRSLVPRLTEYCDENPSATLTAAIIDGFAPFTTFGNSRAPDQTNKTVSIDLTGVGTDASCAAYNITVYSTNGGNCAATVRDYGTTFTGSC